MRPVECEFEADVLSAVVQSRWPQRVDEELRTHVGSCPICADVVAVAGALETTRDELRPSIVVPDSGRVWWVAQLRARREAAKTAGRPITAAQVLAFSCAVALLGACFGATSNWFQSALREAVGSVKNFDWQVLTALVMEHGALAAAMVAVLLLIPAAVYLAVGRD